MHVSTLQKLFFLKDTNKREVRAAINVRTKSVLQNVAAAIWK